jgi:hypothetical protein
MTAQNSASNSPPKETAVLNKRKGKQESKLANQETPAKSDQITQAMT